MIRTIHFIAGMPRSGSTLLCNLLAQNPRFHTTSTSGIINVVGSVYNNWKAAFGTDAHPQSVADRRRVLNAILQCYHDDPAAPQPVVFDKSRAWLGQMGLAEAALGRKVKVLVCVRDIRDVLASFEKLWRRNAAWWAQGHEEAFYTMWQTIEGRCEVMMRPDQVVGGPYRMLKAALAEGFGDRLHFVHYERLTANPQDEVARIYEFLGEQPPGHDFENVKQVTSEDDFVHGIPGLHEIRSRIAPTPSQWPKYLGEAAARYERYNRLWLRSDALPGDELALPGEAGAENADAEGVHGR